jgi:hypothetical protein
VRVAHELLVWWNHEVPVTRGGKWEQLAKIVAGGLNVDFFEHLREFKRSRGPTIEKVRCQDGIVYQSRGRQPGTE